MIHGIGTDIVHVARIETALERHGERFAQRVLAESEWTDFLAVPRHPAALLAKRFAAKEAWSKALGTGFRDGLSLRDVAVSHDALGKPELQFFGRAAELIARFGIVASHVSLADEADYVVAFVILENAR